VSVQMMSNNLSFNFFFHHKYIYNNIKSYMLTGQCYLIPISTTKKSSGIQLSNLYLYCCAMINLCHLLLLKFSFSYFYASATKIYPCPSGYRYMVCPAISSYSFGATALIFCMMFIHIMEVCMSTGFWFSSNIW
jgi:hypothetical protein